MPVRVGGVAQEPRISIQHQGGASAVAVACLDVKKGKLRDAGGTACNATQGCTGFMSVITAASCLQPASNWQHLGCGVLCTATTAKSAGAHGLTVSGSQKQLLLSPDATRHMMGSCSWHARHCREQGATKQARLLHRRMGSSCGKPLPCACLRYDAQLQRADIPQEALLSVHGFCSICHRASPLRVGSQVGHWGGPCPDGEDVAANKTL